MIFNLPDLGEGLPDAEIHEWYVKEGDAVKEDQPIASMETAKAVVDVPAPCTGTIKKLYGKPGDVINTGSPLVEFTTKESAGAAKKEAAPKKEVAREDAATVVGKVEVGETIWDENPMGVTPIKPKKPDAKTQKQTQLKTPPAVRALAGRLGVDLSNITPTGPKGSITKSDVEKAAQSGGHSAAPTPSKTPMAPAVSTASASGAVEPLRGIRKQMALAMAKSHAEVVDVTIVDDANLHAWPPKTDITARIMRAMAYAAQQEPALNAWYDGESMERRLFSEVHIGMAVDAPSGLIVPVIKNAQNLSMQGLRSEINRLKNAARDRSVPPQELQGGTITLSNFGTFAGRYANPVVVPPMVAILGIGRMRQEAVAVNGMIGVHTVLPLSLTFDHRAATGGEATRFLAAVIEDLEKAD